MKKIWIFNHYAHTPENGNITRHYDFAGILQERGYEVTIFTSSAVHNTNINECKNGEPYVEQMIEGRRYVFVKTRSYGSNGARRVLNMMDFYFGLHKVAKKFEKPDVIYASSPHIFTLQAGLKVAKRLKVPCLCEVRDLWPLSIVEYSRLTNKNIGIRCLYQLEKSIYKRADALIFTIPGAEKYLKEHNLNEVLLQKKTIHISNGVNIKKFDDDVALYEDFAKEYYPRNRFSFTFTGAMRSLYRLDFLLDCAKHIQELGYEEIRFVLYGTGGELSKLKQRCEIENIKNVQFMGRVNKACIPALLQQGDVNLLHSKEVDLMQYGISHNKLFEYLASAKPILASFHAYDSPVEKYGCGIESNEQTVQEVVHSMIRLYQMSKEEKDEMGKKARQVAKEFDLPVLVEKLETAIENTITKYKKGEHHD